MVLTQIFHPECSVPEWQLAMNNNRKEAIAEVEMCKRWNMAEGIIIFDLVVVGLIVANYFLFRWLKNQQDANIEKLKKIELWVMIILIVLALSAWLLILGAPTFAEWDLKKHWSQIDSMGKNAYANYMEKSQAVQQFKSV